MADPLFSGVGVALVTLFDGNGDVDAPATAAHAARLADLGVAAVIVAGSTGEAAALDREERCDLIGAVRAAVPADLPVLAGTGAPSARQACRLTRDAVGAGADGVLTLSPAGTADPRPYYEAVASAAEVPVLAYHFPAVSSPGIPVAALADLPVAGCKDSSGDPDRLLEQLALLDGCRPDFALYTGSSAILALAGPLGCRGAILALANVEPERCVQAFTGDAAAQRELAEAHLHARVAFPRGLKELTAKRFGTSTAARLG